MTKIGSSHVGVATEAFTIYYAFELERTSVCNIKPTMFLNLYG